MIKVKNIKSKVLILVSVLAILCVNTAFCSETITPIKYGVINGDGIYSVGLSPVSKKGMKGILLKTNSVDFKQNDKYLIPILSSDKFQMTIELCELYYRWHINQQSIWFTSDDGFPRETILSIPLNRLSLYSEKELNKSNNEHPSYVMMDENAFQLKYPRFNLSPWWYASKIYETTNKEPVSYDYMYTPDVMRLFLLFKGKITIWSYDLTTPVTDDFQSLDKVYELDKLPKFWHWIREKPVITDVPFNDPFYVFKINDKLIFVTETGSLYVAGNLNNPTSTLIAVDVLKNNKIIALIDDNNNNKTYAFTADTYFILSESLVLKPMPSEYKSPAESATEHDIIVNYAKTIRDHPLK